MNAKQKLIAKILKFYPDRTLDDVEAEVLSLSWAERLDLYARLCVRESQAQAIKLDVGTGTQNICYVEWHIQ